MKICLIRPKREQRELVLEDGSGRRSVRSVFNKISPYQIGIGNAVPPLALMVIAALTPPDFEVTIMDEEIEKIDFDHKADLVGITLLTKTARRGYEIADRFRARGVKVVLGGMHATVMPREAAGHADAVVLGEAEQIWPQVLRDALERKLRPFYRSQTFCDIGKTPLPRRDLISASSYITTNLVQTSRGCPHRCDFCSIHIISGRSYRCRPVSSVIAEIGALGGHGVVFIDDNITGDTVYAKQLFQALIPLRIWWFGQATLKVASDDELLALAAKSGCKGLIIGFESLSQENIKRMGKAKTNQVRDYAEAIKKLHAHGICVAGSFMFGLDDDGPTSFKKIVDFINDTDIDLPFFNSLLPLPGTRLFSRLEREERLINKTYWLDPSWRPGDVFFRPKLMTAEELERGSRYVYEHVFSLSAIARRLWRVRRHMAPAVALSVIAFNLRQRKTVQAGAQ